MTILVEDVDQAINKGLLIRAGDGVVLSESIYMHLKNNSFTLASDKDTQIESVILSVIIFFSDQGGVTQEELEVLVPIVHTVARHDIGWISVRLPEDHGQDHLQGFDLENN